MGISKKKSHNELTKTRRGRHSPYYTRQGQVDKDQVKLIQAGQTITVEGRRTKTGSVKHDETKRKETSKENRK